MQGLKMCIYKLGTKPDRVWLTVLIHLPLVLQLCIGELDYHWFKSCSSPVRRQAITWTDTNLLLIGPLRT